MDIYKINKQKFSRGSALVFTLIILSVIFVAAIGISSVSVIEKKTSTSTGKSTSAFQVADSGAEIVLQKGKTAVQVGDLVGNGITCDAEGRLTGSIFSPDKPYVITMYDKDNNKLNCNTDSGEFFNKIAKIKSAGSYAGTSRAVEVDVCDPRKWISESSFPKYDNDTIIIDLLEYDEKLYVSTGDLQNIGSNYDNARIYKFDGTNWTEIYQDSGAININALEIFQGNLYGASGNSGKIVEIMDSDGNGEFDSDSDDTHNFPANLGAINTFSDLQVFDGELWASYSCCNGGNRRLWHYNGAGNFQQAAFGPFAINFGARLGSFDEELYLGENGKIWQCDSSSCASVKNLDSISGFQLNVSSFLEYDNEFFAATANQGGSVGQMYYTADGSIWNVFNNFIAGTGPSIPATYDPWGRLYGMGIYNDGTGTKLYVGAGWYRHFDDLTILEQDGGRLYKYDGTNWSMDVNNFQNNIRIYDLQYYSVNQEFYAGTEINTGSTDNVFKKQTCN